VNKVSHEQSFQHNTGIAQTDGQNLYSLTISRSACWGSL